MTKSKSKPKRKAASKAQPIAQVVNTNTSKRPIRPPRPIHEVLADVYLMLEEKLQIESA